MSEASPGGRSWDEIIRLWFVSAAWLACFVVLARYGVRLLPLALARQLSLQSYLMIVHLVTMAFGLGISLLLLREARRALGWSRPGLGVLGISLLLAPPIYVASSYLAIWIALPTLLEELARGGRELAQKSSGEFGRAITAAPVWSALVWAALVSPLSEELLFRGVAWSAVERLVRRLLPDRAIAAPSSYELPLSEAPALRAARAARRWFELGGIATLVTTAVFTALHADMPGGLGIVRVVSAAGLGLACGVLRQHAGSIAAPILLHVAYNTLSLATSRRWLVSELFPLKLGVPTLLTLLAGVCLMLALLIAGARRLKRA